MLLQIEFSFSGISLLAYRNTTDFCMLIVFYPATLLNSLISSNSLLLVNFFFLGFSIYKIISFANRANFTFFILIWILFFLFFSSLTPLARTASKVLKSSHESGYPCLVSNLRGTAFNLSPSSMMLAVGLLHMNLIMLRYIPSILNLLRVFNHERMLYFVKFSFHIY